MARILHQPREEDIHKDDVMAIVNLNNIIFTGSYDGWIKMWSSDLKLLNSWQAHLDMPVYALAGDETHLFSSSSSGEVKEWDPQSGRLVNSTILKSPADGKTGEVKALFLYNDLLFGGDDKGNLTVWKPGFEVDAHKFIYVEIWSLAVSPDGMNVFTVRDNECIISDFSTKFNNELFAQTLSVRTTISGRAPLAVDKNYVLIVDRSGMTISVHGNEHTKFPQLKCLKEGHDMIINALLVHEKLAVSSGWDGKLILWDIESGSKLSELSWDTYVNCMAWIDKEKRIVLAGGRSGNMVVAQL